MAHVYKLQPRDQLSTNNIIKFISIGKSELEDLDSKLVTMKTLRQFALLSFLVLINCPSFHSELLWDGDASKGADVFGDLQMLDGDMRVVDDPQHHLGKVFRIHCHDNPTSKVRCEVSRMRGLTLENGKEYYVGWRSLWGPLPTKEGKWQVLAQIHYNGHYPPSGAPIPFGLSVPGDGQMHFRVEDPDTGAPTSIWAHKLPIGSWHSYVLHFRMAEAVAEGWMEVWFDGVQQTLSNGEKRINAALGHKDYPGSYFKWGVYRSHRGGPIGDSYHYLWHPRCGTEYEDVAP